MALPHRKISMVEAWLLDEPFRVDGQPTSLAKAENIAMLDVAVQCTDIMWERQRHGARDRRTRRSAFVSPGWFTGYDASPGAK